MHPPLAKLLYALVAYFLGYDGHYHFNQILDNYNYHNVPYIGLRSFSAVIGALIVPLCFCIMQELKYCLSVALFGAFLLLLDNALLTQSRLILLDSMLILFILMSVYSWIMFHKQRHEPFKFCWWYWLACTGFSLGLSVGVKLVGIFVVFAIAVASLIDLWNLFEKEMSDVFLFLQ